MRRLIIIICLFLPVPTYAVEITISRNKSCAGNYVCGALYINGSYAGETLELPAFNNEEYISHIPNGSYSAKIRADGHLAWRLELEEVQDRQNVQIHIGNYPDQTKGCILVGLTATVVDGKAAVSSSQAVLDKISDAISEEAGSSNVNTSTDYKVDIVVEGGVY